MQRRHAALLCLGTCLLLAPSASEAQTVTITGTGDSKRTPLAQRQDAGSSTTAFTLLPGERASVTFGTTEPGTVMVVVQVKGQPLLVTVRDGKGALVAEQGGTGSITLPLQLPSATAQDQNFWVVSMRDSRDTLPPTVALRSVPRPVSSGTVTVSGPVMSAQDFANMMAPRIAAAERASVAVRRRQERAAPVVIDMAPARAVLAQQVAQAQQAQLAAIAPRLPPAAVAQMKQRIDLRARGDVPQQIIVPGGGATTALAGGVVRRAPMTASVSQAAGGAAPVGTGGGAAVAAAPAITNLSVRQGAPGTPVLLEGSAFGDQPGEVRFLVANGTDLPAPVSYWSSSQVFAEVPVKEGVQAFDGYVYVKRTDGSKTALVPFGFQPTSDIVTFCSQNNEMDTRIGNPGEITNTSVQHFTLFAGFAGYDELNLQQRLTNGWRIMAVELRALGCSSQQAGVYRSIPTHSGAYIVDWRPGTDSPYVKVRWWIDPTFFDFNYLSYNLAITVTGPKGLSFR